MRSGIRHAVLLGLTLVSASCISLGHGAESTGPVTLRVTNANSMSVNVFVLAYGYSTRMGTVSTAQTSSYTVPESVWQATGGMRVRIDPIGSGATFTTERIHGVEAGSTINVEVAADLRQTWYQVRYPPRDRGAPSSTESAAPSGRPAVYSQGTFEEYRTGRRAAGARPTPMSGG